MALKPTPPIPPARGPRKAVPAKKATAPMRRYESLGEKNGPATRTAPSGSVKRSVPGDPSLSPAQRKAAIAREKEMFRPESRLERAVGNRQLKNSPKVHAKVQSGKMTADAAYARAERVYGAATKVSKAASAVGKIAGRAAGAAGLVGAAYETGQTLTNPKKLKSAATGSRAATKAARGTATTASPMNMSGVGSVNAKSKKAMNAKSDAAKPVRKYAKSTPANDVTKRKGWTGGRGTM